MPQRPKLRGKGSFFQIQAVPESGMLDRLRGRQSKQAVVVQIRNLLASTPFEEISPDDVSAILNDGRLDFSDIQNELVGMFEEAIQFVASDWRFTAPAPHA